MFKLQIESGIETIYYALEKDHYVLLTPEFKQESAPVAHRIHLFSLMFEVCSDIQYCDTSYLRPQSRALVFEAIYQWVLTCILINVAGAEGNECTGVREEECY